RPYLYRYSDQTGMSVGGSAQSDYNRAYVGFWLVTVDAQGKERQAMIKRLANERTQILLDGRTSQAWKTGDSFEIRLLAPGDKLEIPVWAEAERGTDGKWQVRGTGRASIGE